jgi:serine/threonine protein kinase
MTLMKAAKKHPDREQLSAFLRGGLSSSDHDAVAAHIAACDSCCEALRVIPDDAFLARLRDANSPADASKQTRSKREPELPVELQNHPRYKVGKFLGAGGMGLVYQAEHRIMDRLVALKVLHQDLMRNPRVIKRFHQEVKAAAKLAHPNIVTAFDADQAGDAHFLVMEFVDGMSLDRLIAKRGPLEPAYACHFIRQAAKGLEHAFQAGMVHRDIKPQNLMLTRNGQVKILDFGLARLAAETRAEFAAGPDETPASSHAGITNFGEIVGTPDFMAPEQSFDATQADIRADIYSLGCTLYFLLTGQKPFRAASARAKVYSQRYAQPTPISSLRDDLPEGLSAVLEKMMAKDPAQRYQTPPAVIKALAPFAKLAPAAAPAPAVPPPAPPKKVVAPEPIIETIPAGSKGVLVRCPFCQTKVRIKSRLAGTSLSCPQCGSYFTAVPEDEGSGPRG